ncbi:exodeoxyribonuclease X C-terminal domain-containing protein [Marixanthomonas spongiae]|uniref:exodeoxyribonuclease X C-terminal domain-containing protein n=1 Tax=Marixanthomonas spongiae TaxID=2174845 RepID=UPI0014041863|nr:hypothetical protein [Marixanthomonas spongiae]
MTKQIKEIIEIDNKNYYFNEEPIEQFWLKNNSKIKLERLHTACHRGYVGTWKIIDNYLHLIKIKNESSNKKDLSIRDFFPQNNQSEVKATWYDGKITVAIDEEIYPICERKLILEIHEGKLVNKYIIENVKNIHIDFALKIFQKNTDFYNPEAERKKHFLKMVQYEFKLGHFHLAEKYINLYLDNVDKKYYGKLIQFYLIILIKNHSLNYGKQTMYYNNLQMSKDRILEKLNNFIELENSEIGLQKLMVYKFDYYIHWGKYDGSSIIDIMNDDPNYILWCILNLEHFIIELKLFLYKSIRKNKSYLSALEVNLTKMAFLKNTRETSPEFLIETDTNLYNPQKSNKTIYDDFDMKSADWDYDYNNPAHDQSENPWIEVFGPGDEAETAYWNTN